MNVKKMCITLLILVSPFKLFSQDTFNPIAPKDKSEEFNEYLKIIDNIKIKSLSKTTNSLKKLNQNEINKIFALGFFARLNNPNEIHKQQRSYVRSCDLNNKKPTKNYYTAPEIFRDKELVKQLPFDKKYILFDLMLAPFVFIGTITEIDTLYEASVGHVIKYEMIIYDKVIDFYKEKVSGKKMNFLVSTAHIMSSNKDSYLLPKRIKNEPYPENKFTIGNKYLIFISAETYNFHKLKGTINENLPTLKFTSMANLNFPIKNLNIIDELFYFGKEKEVSIDDVKNILNNYINELSKLKE